MDEEHGPEKRKKEKTEKKTKQKQPSLQLYWGILCRDINEVSRQNPPRTESPPPLFFVY